MAIHETHTQNHKKIGYRSWAGIAFIFSGILVALDQYLKTGWLILVIVPVVGLAILAEGVHIHRLAFIIPGCLISFLGIGSFLVLRTLAFAGWPLRIGVLLVAFSIGWFTLTAFSALIIRRTAWWSFLVGAILASTGACFLFSSYQVFDFVLYCSAGSGLALIIWGISQKLLGLIIPGCLVATIGPGIYQAWNKLTVTNGLAQTGVMLVWFALGWGIITVFSRVLTEKFIWWPLIPGGILAMVGCGLYIGGNPENAVAFLGNTGSVGLVIFGIYLLLLRKGIQG
jgi:hypothetical protein